MQPTMCEHPFFLAGMMGAGKSTVGQGLARRWRCPFIDLDMRIERMFAASVTELFARGEPEFRERESEALRSLGFDPGFLGRRSVIALGGGTVLAASNRQWMAECGTSIYLKVEVVGLVVRLQSQENQDGRPLLSGTGGTTERLSDRLERLLMARRANYESCSIIVDGGPEPDEVVDRIESLFGEVDL